MYKLHGWCSLRVYFQRNNDESGWEICVSKTTRMALTLVWLPWREDLHQDGSYWCEHNHQDGVVTITNVVILKGTINVRMAKLLVWVQPPGWHWHWCGYLERNDFHQDGKVTGVSRTTRMTLTLVWLPWRGRSASGWQSYWCDYTDTPHRPRRCRRLHFLNSPPHNRRSTTSWSK